VTVLHTGSNNQYSERWQLIFSDKKNAKSVAKRTSKSKTTKPVARAKSTKKAAPKRKSK